MADLDLLRSFVSIYRNGSVSGAARQLGFTQPTLTQHLKAQEAHLGRPLFKRQPRGMLPTPAAHALALGLGEHLDALVATVEAARAGGTRTSGPVLLGGPAALLGAKVLPSLGAKDLWQDGIRLQVRVGNCDEQLQVLKDGGLDLVISPEKTAPKGLRWQPLYREELMLVGSPRWAGRLNDGVLKAQGSAAFEAVPLISCEEECRPLHRYLQEVFEARAPDAVMEVNDLRAVLEATLSGLGVTVLPSYLCGPALERGTLVQLHHPAAAPSTTLCLVRRPALRADSRVDRMWKLLVRLAEGW